MALVSVNWHPDRRQLRGFGTIATVAFAALGAWVYFRHGIVGLDLTPQTAARTAQVLWGLAGLSLVLRFVSPPALRPLYLALTLITLPIGWVLSHVLLAVLFYGVLTPIGLVRRVFGSDALARRFLPRATTYWVKRKPVQDVKQYYRQF